MFYTEWEGLLPNFQRTPQRKDLKQRVWADFSILVVSPNGSSSAPDLKELDEKAFSNWQLT